jgi:hypothetical protein
MLREEYGGFVYVYLFKDFSAEKLPHCHDGGKSKIDEDEKVFFIQDVAVIYSALVMFWQNCDVAMGKAGNPPWRIY